MSLGQYLLSVKRRIMYMTSIIPPPINMYSQYDIPGLIYLTMGSKHQFKIILWDAYNVSEYCPVLEIRFVLSILRVMNQRMKHALKL